MKKKKLKTLIKQVEAEVIRLKAENDQLKADYEACRLRSESWATKFGAAMADLSILKAKING